MAPCRIHKHTTLEEGIGRQMQRQVWYSGGMMKKQWMDALTGVATTLGLQSPSSLDPASCGVQSPSLSVSRLLTVAGLSSTPPTLCTGGLKLLLGSISNFLMHLCLELAVLLCNSSRLDGFPQAAGVFGASQKKTKT
jgi:hypothetical protein